MAFNRRYRRILLPDNQWLEDGVIRVEKQRITALLPYQRYLAQQGSPLEIHDVSLMPGLIDSHIHGAMGVDVMDANYDALNTISLFLASQGVVAFLATTVTAPVDTINMALKSIENAVTKGVDGATLLGAYLEGPYLSEKHRGAHPISLLRELDLAELKHWIAVANGCLKVVALAPEKSDSLAILAYLKAHNINVMLAHSNASYQQAKTAIQAGADGIVHCYNGMSGLHHREPGMVGAALCCDSAYVELIADGHHVHPVAIDVVWRCTKDTLVLVSDSMRATGMPNGQYKLGELNVTMQDGVVKTETDGLAGSTLTLLTAVNNICQWLSIPLEQSWQLASQHPAAMLGIDHDLGSLAVGKIASMVELSEKNNVVATWVRGKCVFSQTEKIKNSFPLSSHSLVF